MGRYWIIIALCASSFCVSEAQRPTVKFSNTMVQGVVNKTRKGRDVESFWSIPYAEPPIGNLRFSDPIPKAYSDGTTIQGDQPPKRCLQSVPKRRGLLGSPTDLKGDEDCLYLNVHRPASAGNQPLPVMVYFQTADLVPGTEDNPHIGPDYLLDGDLIILVTLTYRLGVFGFLTTGDEAAPGNFGLKDQKVGLQWVQSNIAGFGGDPNRVTLFGNGDASRHIHIQALVDHTTGLFHQYILQSGTALAPWAVSDSTTGAGWTETLATLNECPTDSSSAIIDCLRQMDSRELLELSFKGFDIMDIFFFKIWTPTKERSTPGAYLTCCPEDLMTSGCQRDLPFIAGVGLDEKQFKTSVSPSSANYWDESNQEVYNIYNATLGSPDLIEAVSDLYEKLPDNLSDDDREFREGFRRVRDIEEYLSDAVFYSPQVQMLDERRNNSGKPFYFYSFEYRGEFSLFDWLNLRHGTGRGIHGDVLLYLFDHDFSKFPGAGDSRMTEEDYQVLDMMVQTWTSFATNGVPRSEYGEIWKPYDSEGQYLDIGSVKRRFSPKMRTGFHTRRMKYWANLSLQHCE